MTKEDFIRELELKLIELKFEKKKEIEHFILSLATGLISFLVASGIFLKVFNDFFNGLAKSFVDNYSPWVSIPILLFLIPYLIFRVLNKILDDSVKRIVKTKESRYDQLINDIKELINKVKK